MNYPAGNMFKLHACAVCQLGMKPGEGISVHGNMPKHSRVDPWGGPFLCSSCQVKKKAMEGKLHSAGKKSLPRDYNFILHRSLDVLNTNLQFISRFSIYCRTCAYVAFHDGFLYIGAYTLTL
jgi:hypothetical protein